MAKLDNKTAELPGLPALPKKRGPKPSGHAKSAAQRMADSRARRRADLAPLIERMEAVERGLTVSRCEKWLKLEILSVLEAAKTRLANG